MDRTQERLADYCVASDYACLRPDTIHRYERHLLDSLACALGAGDAPPCAIARRLAARVRGTPAARVIGLPEPTSLEMAAFANGVLVRYLDFNDQLISGHPSDGISALLAVAEGLDLGGRDLLAGLHMLYEVYGRLMSAALLRDRGWDQGTFVVVAVACGVGKLLGLSRRQMAEAIALALSDNVAIRQTRAGALSYWKGCVTANAARNGVFAALLAAEGMTGPTQPFEGTHGFWEQVSGPFTLDLPPPGEAPLIEQAALKYFPVEYNAQGPAWAALELRQAAGAILQPAGPPPNASEASPSGRGSAGRAASDSERGSTGQALPVDQLVALEFETTRFTWTEIGRDPEKWAPTDRETADHSLPYIVATVLRHGTIGPEHFAPAHLADPAVRALMARIRVQPNEAFTRRWPAENPCRLTARTADGRTHVVEVAQPRGHPANPLTDAEIEAKFERLAAGVLPPARRRAVLDFVWALPAQPRVARLLDLLTPVPSAPA